MRRCRLAVLARYRRSASGNVAITFALAIVPVLWGAGAATDWMRANNAQTSLQRAADAAALASGASVNTTDEDIQAVASQYLTANGVPQAVKALTTTELIDDRKTGAFRVKLKGKVKTSFLALAGIPEIDIGAESEVMRGGSGPIELVLALDATSSMFANNTIGTLKSAANGLVTTVMAAGNAKVGVVPFSDRFAAGIKYKDEPRIDAPTGKAGSCGFIRPDRSGCTVRTTVLDMTTVQSEVKNAIDMLSPSGKTNIPSGLMWAWKLLTPEAPLTKSAPMPELSAKGRKKVMVLTTDGGSFGNHADTPYGNGTHTDSLTAQLCQDIKDEGVVVYTILLNVADPGIASLLRDCASAPEYSFAASGSTELSAAFDTIGVSLTGLRLVR